MRGWRQSPNYRKPRRGKVSTSIGVEAFRRNLDKSPAPARTCNPNASLYRKSGMRISYLKRRAINARGRMKRMKFLIPGRKFLEILDRHPLVFLCPRWGKRMVQANGTGDGEAYVAKRTAKSMYYRPNWQHTICCRSLGN